ncbi:MAG: AI-2E family transporter [Fimbriimonadales bacterium]|jgi:predicted PurR-regulated permease PerM|nr:AI-2E family transporter [Armatimonadota bacterium]MCX7688467.1 AI-2E family transporter [Fimbriimonadales bacterium]CUU02892.1 Predicted PurR-regulated permease PerM [Armatimonadetes bacterium GBS]CUU34380.1 Predicted PurR-regulated permease PerM [Armatimonadetes bacterium DC]CUU38753.1 Predicted PurR-regulated permease PerM [Armatimonadetes bacterium GXS]GBC89528.1 hypothetical protein HRbin14_00253 [bacterium HR14]
MTWRVLGWVAVVSATLYFLYFVRDALIPFAIGGIIALLLNPIVEWRCKRGLSRPKAVLAVFSMFLLLVVLLGILATPVFYAQALGLIESFSGKNGGADIEKVINTWVNDARAYLQAELPKHQKWLEANSELLQRLGLPTDPKALTDALTVRLRDRVSAFFLDNAASFLNGLLGTLLSLLSKVVWIIVIPLSAYFFLLDMPSIKRAILFLVPPAQRAAVNNLLSEIGDLFFRYIRGLVTAALSYGMVSMLLYWMLGVPNPLLLGVLAGVLYPIPYVGAFLIALSSTGFTLLFGPAHPLLFLFELSRVWHAIAVLLGAIALNTVFDMLITPRLLGGAVGLRPLASLIVIVVGAKWGIWGMMLAVPVATTLKIIIERLLHFFYGEAEFLEAPEPIHESAPSASSPVPNAPAPLDFPDSQGV